MGAGAVVVDVVDAVAGMVPSDLLLTLAPVTDGERTDELQAGADGGEIVGAVPLAMVEAPVGLDPDPRPPWSA